MLYMVIERFRHGDAASVYRRFREHGRMAPPGLEYIASWVTDDLTTCYQVMQTDERPSSTNGWRTGATWSISKCCRL